MGAGNVVSRSYLRELCASAAVLASACASNGAEVPVAGDDPQEQPTEDVLPSRVVEGPCATMTNDALINVALTGTNRVLVADLTVTPSATTSVHGLANGAADSMSDLAAAVRFESGTIAARDGQAYRADQAVSYTAGTSVDLRIIADLASRTYSVLAGEVVIAKSFAMTASPRLDMLASYGEAEVCAASEAPDVIFRRAGAHAVIADAGVISDGATTTRIGASGEVLASLSRGGELAATSDTIYVARVVDQTLTIDALTTALGERWSRSYAAAAGSHVQAMAISGDAVIIVLANDGQLAVRAVGLDGAARWTRDLDAAAAVPNATGFALARTANGSVTIEQLDAAGASVWARAFAADVTVDQIASSPVGQIVLGGTYAGTIDFGGGPIAAHGANSNDKVLNAYVLALSPSGEHVFSNRISEERVAAIATNGAHTIIAGEHVIGPTLTTRYTFDQTGNILDWNEGIAAFGWFGPTYRLALSSANRVYWSYGPAWPDDFTAQPQLVAY